MRELRERLRSCDPDALVRAEDPADMGYEFLAYIQERGREIGASEVWLEFDNVDPRLR